MSVSVKGDEYEEAHDQIYGFWEEAAMNDGANSLEKLYMAGHPRRAQDEYLWELSTGKKTFTYAEIDEMERQLKLIEENSYPQAVKGAVATLLRLLKNNRALNSRAKNQALRNVYESRTGQGAAPGQGPANLIRKFAGIRVPKGAEGGKRSRKMRKTRKVRKAKKTRKH